MKSASPGNPKEQTVFKTVDVTVDHDRQNSDSSSQDVTSSVSPDNIHPGQSTGNGGSSAAIVRSSNSGSFSSFLAPLKKDNFVQVVKEVEQKLKTVNETLSILDNLLDAQGFEAILNEMLCSITLKTGELLSADRTTIWLVDDDKQELWSIVAKGEDGRPLELRIPSNAGIAGEAATSKKVVSIPYDFYDDPRSQAAKESDRKYGYRTYTMMAMPLLNEEEELVAVVQLLNKLKPESDLEAPLEEKIDKRGFTEDDEQLFTEFVPSIRLILESSKSFYAATQKQRAAKALMNAVNSLSKCSLDLEETLKNVMDQAKELMNADRSTLWLLDAEKGELWTKIPIEGKLTEIRIPAHAGFAGIVADTGEPLLISFDVYEDPRSVKSQETDQKTGYRTCSLLCMPVFNSDDQLIGVTQLINKKKQGGYPPYDPETWPEPPEQWKASFNRNDLEFMRAFNIQAGIALQNAKLFETVRQQEQMQRDILRSLSNGVISTDRNGKIIATNECAQELLGLSDADVTAGQYVPDLIHLKEGDFTKWFETALHPKDTKDRQQYYPDQTLLSGAAEEPQSINLSINSMSDVSDPKKVSGVLVVMEDISGEKEVKNLIYRYMTPEVAEQLLASGDIGLGGKRKDVTVLFSDIRSYTTLTEKLQAEEVVTMLNEYFEEMVDTVLNYKGTLDKYIGDALMAVFGSPAPLEDHPWMAMQAALEMRYRLEGFNQIRVDHGLLPISIGMGLHSDEVISGNIGSSKRMELTSIGDGVNLASRLEGTSKQYGTDIIISDNTYHRYAERLIVRELDYITVKGKSKPVKIYELVGIREGKLARPLSEDQQNIIDHYHKGREYYLKTAREKLSEQHLIELLHQLEELSEAQIKKLSYNDKELIEEMLLEWSLTTLVDILGENTVDRLELEALKASPLEQALVNVRDKAKAITPRDTKKLLIAKLKQFSADPKNQQMLEDEAKEMSLPQLRKLIDLAKKEFATQAKEAFRKAKREFLEVLNIDPKNKAAKLHVDRCILYETTKPPSENWDGVWKLTEK
ncbi:adenylate cyclase [Lyngbya aestuarii BL J]|uniref:Adenylate cyclase n=1 Tax=Lyngbya aestuarii BL J TaxID=1348334 RepID=U7QF80_9CYAN|nr:adenylate/guanylate cyclase domain-containing protein [Lyngbya aestuarii]ERT05897.1 adenylate cyclase [Lyngbya aestuarii BL J]